MDKVCRHHSRHSTSAQPTRATRALSRPLGPGEASSKARGKKGRTGRPKTMHTAMRPHHCATLPCCLHCCAAARSSSSTSCHPALRKAAIPSGGLPAIARKITGPIPGLPATHTSLLLHCCCCHCQATEDARPDQPVIQTKNNEYTSQWRTQQPPKRAPERAPGLQQHHDEHEPGQATRGFACPPDSQRDNPVLLKTHQRCRRTTQAGPGKSSLLDPPVHSSSVPSSLTTC
jgi:hypothetical protein